MSTKKPTLIVIDAGHGGSDKWNRGPTGYIEAVAMLAMALYLRSFLIATYKDITVVLTRETDVFLDLSVRGKFAKNADIFISLHSNADKLGTSRGVEAFISVKHPFGLAREIATLLTARISAEYKVPNRGVKLRANTRNEDYYGILRHPVATGCPVNILVESLFHNNLEDEAILKQDKNIRRIAEIIGGSIGDGTKLQLIPPPVTVPAHWADADYDYVNSFLIGAGAPPLSSKQFDVAIKRGEMFALMAKVLKALKNEGGVK